MVSVFDSEISASVFADDEIKSLLSDVEQIRSALEVEAKLAMVQQALGVIPEGKGDTISRLLSTLKLEPKFLATAYAKDGISTPGLVRLTREQLPAEVGNFLHWGATSQDIEDSALVLRLKSLTRIMASRLDTLIALLQQLTESHRHTLTVARTRTQWATPTVFGLKTASWLAPLQRQKMRLHSLLPRLLVVQLGGAGGTLAAMGVRAAEVSRNLAATLDLNSPSMPWHNQRDNIVEFSNWLAMTSGIIGKMGQDFLLLAQSEVAEIGFTAAGGSSTMPQKSNPVIAENLVALARFSGTQIGTVHQTLLTANERDGVSMTLERMSLPALISACASSLRLAIAAIDNIEIRGKTMLANLEKSNGMVLAEAAVFELSKFIDRKQATEIVYKACRDASDNGRHLIAELSKSSDAEVDWEQLKNPQNYLGVAQDFIDRVLEDSAMEGYG
ncbi:MAG: adenylosuccinate lyase family protein [Pseudohongiellaceae bacterium]|jgi:3-carboxy-cis,cis-muconate cycloisomerase